MIFLSFFVLSITQQYVSKFDKSSHFLLLYIFLIHVFLEAQFSFVLNLIFFFRWHWKVRKQYLKLFIKSIVGENDGIFLWITFLLLYERLWRVMSLEIVVSLFLKNGLYLKSKVLFDRLWSNYYVKKKGFMEFVSDII